MLTTLSIVAQGSLYAGSNDWTNVGPEGGGFRLLVFDPKNPGIIYAPGVGVFKSTDGGAHWVEADFRDIGPKIAQALANREAGFPFSRLT